MKCPECGHSVVGCSYDRPTRRSLSHVDKWIMEIPPEGLADRLTCKKAKQILAAEQGSEITGVVICCPDGRRAIVEMSAVRWLDGEGAWDLMHPKPAIPAPPLDEDAKACPVCGSSRLHRAFFKGEYVGRFCTPCKRLHRNE